MTTGLVNRISLSTGVSVYWMLLDCSINALSRSWLVIVYLRTKAKALQARDGRGDSGRAAAVGKETNEANLL